MSNTFKKLALEMIAFGGNPKLGPEIEKIIEKSFKYRDDNCYNKNLTLSKKINIMDKYSKSVFFPEFRNILKKYLNLDLDHIEFYKDEKPLIAFATYAILINGDYLPRILLDDISTGEGSLNGYSDYFGKDVKKKMEVLKEACSNMDPNSGKINKSEIDKNGKKYTLSTKMFIDICSMFFVEDYFTNGEVKNFTPGEITAILLHEIGHSIAAMLRYVDDYYTITKSYTDIQNILTKSLKVDEYKEAVNILNEYLPEAIKNDIKVKPILENMKTVCSYVEQVNNKDSDVGLISSSFRIAFKLIEVIMFFLVTLLVSYIVYIVFAPLIFSVELLTRSSPDTFKRGDLFSTKHNFYLSERDADEFAIRCGYGPDSVSAHIKLESIISILDISGINNKIGIINTMNRFLHYTRISFFPAYSEDWIYENDYGRLKRMIQSNIAVLKQMNLSPEVYKEYTDDHTKMLKQYDEFLKIRKENKAILKFMKIITNLPGNIASLLTDTNIASEYDKIQNQIEDLINNPLYYQQARLKLLQSTKR